MRFTVSAGTPASTIMIDGEAAAIVRRQGCRKRTCRDGVPDHELFEFHCSPV